MKTTILCDEMMMAKVLNLQPNKMMAKKQYKIMKYYQWVKKVYTNEQPCPVIPN